MALPSNLVSPGLSQQWNYKNAVIVSRACLAFLVLNRCCCVHAHAHVRRGVLYAFHIDTAFHVDKASGR